MYKKVKPRIPNLFMVPNIRPNFIKLLYFGHHNLNNAMLRLKYQLDKSSVIKFNFAGVKTTKLENWK
jgi:hypothetical protein